MDPKTSAGFLEQEWNVITAAPFSFFGAVLAVGFIIWAVIHFLYKGRLDNKDSEISLLARQLDQAKQDIGALESTEDLARVVQQWPDPLLQTFTRLTSGEELSFKVRPQTPAEEEVSANATYLVSMGFADVQNQDSNTITVSSSAAATSIMDRIYPDPDENK